MNENIEKFPTISLYVWLHSTCIFLKTGIYRKNVLSKRSAYTDKKMKQHSNRIHAMVYKCRVLCGSHGEAVWLFGKKYMYITVLFSSSINYVNGYPFIQVSVFLNNTNGIDLWPHKWGLRWHTVWKVSGITWLVEKSHPFRRYRWQPCLGLGAPHLHKNSSQYKYFLTSYGTQITCFYFRTNVCEKKNQLY